MTSRSLSSDPADTAARQKRLRRAFGAFPSGVAAVCAVIDGAPVGVAASSFTSLSLDPPLVSVAFAATSATWPLLRGASRLGLSILGEQHADVCRALAGPAEHRFRDVGWTADADGAVEIEGNVLALTCSVSSVVTVGDHELAVLLVHEARGSDGEPLVFHGSRFRRVVG